jgi:hypothetical protein
LRNHATEFIITFPDDKIDAPLLPDKMVGFLVCLQNSLFAGE